MQTALFAARMVQTLKRAKAQSRLKSQCSWETQWQRSALMVA